ncbi:MAG TPA: zinc-dependent metalloprotease [Mycobacteriales bacterium]|nr:zinc-dependent metalloprotease [Mycobacteriales bacterium]
MSVTPGDEPLEPEANPFAALFGAAGSPDLASAFHRLGDLFSGQSGPVNWQLARETALEQAGADDPGTSAADARAVEEAIRLADLWLDPVTSLASGVTTTEAWSRRRWVEATQPAWERLTDPVVGHVVAAMGSVLPEQAQAMAGPLLGVVRQIGGLVFGAQLGQALGGLAGEVVSSTDIGLPLGPAGLAALLPANVAAFGAGLELPVDDVRIFLALREATHHRLFRRVPWLPGYLTDAVETYAQGIRIDPGALEEALREVDPTDAESLQRALAGGLFEPQNTPGQQAALLRLETALALVEGWVDEVVDAAADGHLPSAAALGETVRRRRASGGPAEQTLATLVGLELRPRRAREAAGLWRALRAARGIDGRDAVWSHQELLPDAGDLADPAGYVGRGGDELDLSGLE